MTRARRRSPAGSSVKIHGPALRFVREAAGRSIADLARVAGVSVGFLARVERGEKRGVGVEVFSALVDELQLQDERVILVNPYVSAVTAHMIEQNGSTVLPCSSTTRAA